MKTRACTFAVLILAVTPTPSAAQSVSEVLSFLLTNRAVQTDDFQRDAAAAAATRDTVTTLLGAELATLPPSLSSAGFTYRFNSALGTAERASMSFGSFFTERSLTSGKGQAALGVNMRFASYNRLDGRDLRDGEFVTTANQFRDEAAPFDTESLILHLRSSMMTVFGSVGIGNRVEVGAAVPFVQLTLDGQRINNYRGSTLIQASGNATASGIADMALRGKVNLVAVRAGGVAVAGEVRLPTGDATNLLGAGKSSLRLMGIGSLERGAVALHGNAALVRGGISSEYDFSGALSIAVDPRVTISGETLIRKVTELHSLELVSAPHPALLGVDTFRLAPSLGAETLASIVTGVKWNVTHTLVIGGHLNFPLSRGGLTAPLTPTVALEYAF